MPQFQRNLSGFGVLGIVRFSLEEGEIELVEEACVCVDVQSGFRTGHTHINDSLFLIRREIVSIQEHENRIKLSAFCLVNCRYKHRAFAAFYKVLRFGFVNKFQ